MPLRLPLLCLLVALLPAAALAGAGERSPSGAKGVVLDATCYGPCAIDEEPEPYRGENARIAIRKPADPGYRLGSAVEQGHFRIRLAPGVYSLTAHVPGDPCWEGISKRARVYRGEFRRVELIIGNACVV